MPGIQYSELANRLTADADELFTEMVLAHIEAGSGDRFFIRSDTLSGTGLHFRGPGVSKTWRNFDGGAIEDLIGYSLLHVNYSGRGTPNYRITGEGLHFYQWLMEKKGSAISQVEDVVRNVVSGDEFARDHPGAAHHLAEAFALLWSDRDDDQTIAEIGEHLRGALIDITHDVIESELSIEKPIERLRTHLQNDHQLSDREVAVVEQLIGLAEATMRLDQRLTHIRDETDKGRPLRSWDEARRAGFITAVVCYEIHSVLAE